MIGKRTLRRRSRAAGALALSLAVIGAGFAPLLNAAPSFAEEPQAPASESPTAQAPGDIGPQAIANFCEAEPVVGPLSMGAGSYFSLERVSGGEYAPGDTAAPQISIRRVAFNEATTTIDAQTTPVVSAEPVIDVNLGQTSGLHYTNALGVSTDGSFWFIDQRRVYQGSGGQPDPQAPRADVYKYELSGDPANPSGQLILVEDGLSLNSPIAGYIVGGGVEPNTGDYYFGYFSDLPPVAVGDGKTEESHRRLHLYRVAEGDAARTGEVAHVDFPVKGQFTSNAGNMNGDLAFDRDGNLYMIVSESAGVGLRVMVPSGEIAGLPGLRQVEGVPTVDVADRFVVRATAHAANINGAAFTEDGDLITESGRSNVVRDSTSFEPINSPVDLLTHTTTPTALVDLASCAAPAPLAELPGFELEKTADPASGSAVQAGDRITYTVTGTNTGTAVLDPAVVTDDLSGVLAHAEYQEDVRAVVVDGDLNERDVTSDVDLDGTDLAWTGQLHVGERITITYSVIVNDGVEGQTLENRVTASGTPPPPTPTEPPTPIEPPAVTTEHPVPGFEIAKTADPESGTAVEPGQTITYTVTGTNTGATLLDPATLTDDLGEVFAHASYNDDVQASVGTVQVEGDTLDWRGTLPVGDSVTITYSVTVNDDAAGELLHNIVRGEATPVTPTDPTEPIGPENPGKPGEPIVPPEEETEHPVDPGTPVDPTAPRSGFEITKTADPASGTEVEPGEIITYSVTGENTGETVLDPAAIADDLSGVLEHAAYNDDARASAGTVRVSGDELSWAGRLAPGETVTITYSVTVNADAAGVMLHNVVNGEAVPRVPVDPTDPEGPTEPGEPITPPERETEHPVGPQPGFAIAKSADPASGTTVQAGQKITYTVTGTNTGDTLLEPATIVDDLSGVLAHAAYNDDVRASSGDAIVSGHELTWTGSLEAGEAVTITYSVTVNADAAGELIHNRVSGEATPVFPTDPTRPIGPENPGVPGEPIVPPEQETEHPVDPGEPAPPVNPADPQPGFAIAKSADPASGTTVRGGQKITYTVTGTNTGNTVLDPATITDDLSKVLAHAAYNSDARATSGDLSVSEDTLSWSGRLGIGEAVTITYSVTVNEDAGGQVVENVVTGEATPLIPVDPADPEGPTAPGEPIAPPPAATEHPVDPADPAAPGKPGDRPLVSTGSTLVPALGALAAALLAAGAVVLGIRRRKA